MAFRQKKRLKLIVNPEASVGRAQKSIPLIQECLGSEFFLDIVVTTEVCAAATAASAAGGEGVYAVIACGGDGTLSEVVNGIVSSKRSLPLGFIPLGTSNVFAQSAGIPRDPISACKVIVAGKRKRIDIGKLSSGKNTHYFVSHAGIGYDAELLFSLKQEWRRIFGVVNAHLLRGFFLIFQYPSPKIVASIDGEEYSCYSAIIANGKAYGVASIVVPDADLCDGYLNVCLFKRRGRHDLVRYIAGVAWNFHSRFRDVEFVRAKHMKFESSEKVYAQCDGEPITQLPLEIEVCSQAIEAILP